MHRQQAILHPWQMTTSPFDDMVLIEDTRQQAHKHIDKQKYFERAGITLVRSKLLVGDYQIAGKGNIAVDTKKDMLELFMDLGKDHKRFSRECQLAAQSGIKLVVLVEEPCPSKGLETWVSPVFKSSNSYHYAGEPKSKANPATMKKIMQTMTKRYGVEFKFCRKADAGRHVIEILMGKE